MSIDANFDKFSEPSVKPVERDLEALSELPFETEEAMAEREARLAELVETIRSEFFLVSKGIERLRDVEVTVENLPKIAFVAERIAALANISPELAEYPELQGEFSESVVALANAFLQVVGKKFAGSKNPEEWFSAYVEMRTILQSAINLLVRSGKR